MLAKINFLTVLSALVFFFLPWIDIQCSNKSIATQTGVQTIFGGATASDQLKAIGKPQPAAEKKDESLGRAPLIAIALVDVVAALVFAFLALRGGNPRHATLTGILSAVALALIVIQMAAGFPARKSLEESMVGSTAERTYDGSAGMSAGLASAAMLNIEVRPLPALYLELVALGLPTLILVNGLLDRLRVKR